MWKEHSGQKNSHCTETNMAEGQIYSKNSKKTTVHKMVLYFKNNTYYYSQTELQMELEPLAAA